VNAGRVGPVLESGEVGRAIVAAIEHENEDVVVEDRGAYVRVGVVGRCHVSGAAIARELGRPFRLPGDLEQAMPSFVGRLSLDSDGATWETGPK
jgi:hypothetical protein